MTILEKKHQSAILTIFISLSILITYWQVKGHAFLIYDDTQYVSANHYVQSGLSVETIRWAFLNTDTANWHPLTWISHMIDMELYGLKAGAHHWMNLIFHLVNSLLLFYLLHSMTGRLWLSGIVGMLFGLHPLHVESVAWISERKDLLYALFWLAALKCYRNYSISLGTKDYGLAFVFFFLSLMAKPMAVTFPLVLCLIDFWPLQRHRNGSDSKPAILPSQPVTLSRLALEKIPFLLGSLLIGIATIMAQKGGGAIGSLHDYTIGVRLANALVSYGAYIQNTVWPFQLAPFYPHPGSYPLWKPVVVLLLLALTSVLAIRYRKQQPWFITGWIWYIVTLLPVIGIIQVGQQARADRYMYLPIVGLLIIIIWGLDAMRSRIHIRRTVFAAISLVSIVILGLASIVQISHWKDSVTLFEHVIHVTRENQYSQNALGNALMARGDIEQAIHHYQRAIEIESVYAKPHYNLAYAFYRQKNVTKATNHLNRALQIDPEYAEALDLMGFFLAQDGKSDDAIYHHKKAISYNPRLASAYRNLGDALVRQQQYQSAIGYYREAIQLKPLSADTYNQMGIALIALGRREEAIRCIQKAIALNPGHAAAKGNLIKLMHNGSGGNPDGRREYDQP
jgi:tetratricopeptide (TPR) repeat protein